MTNRSDLFDDEPQRPPPAAQESGQAAAPSGEPAAEGPPAGAPPGGGGGSMDKSLSRRDFLLGASAAAVAGAVVGAGAAAGLGALSDGDGGGAVTELDGMTLGAPPGRMLSQAVVRLRVNGKDHWVEVDANETLAEVLRRKLGLTGTKIGCDRSECSACTVIIDGETYNSCSLLAIREEGREITTIEGLSANGDLSPVQQAFMEKMGLQCGFCTPGQIMQATALLAKIPKPSEDDIRRHMSGNLCKCSAYPNIMAAIQQAAGVAPAT
jgi:xanthine dehydrogenase YagT iron-sulfur-binding subunit